MEKEFCSNSSYEPRSQVQFVMEALISSWKRSEKKMATEYKEVGIVSALNLYPLKSCKGISLKEANCNEYGFDYDRHWAILDRGGRIVSLTSNAAPALIVPSFVGETLKIEAPGMEPLFVPLKVIDEKPTVVDVDLFGMPGSGIHVSNEADEWLTKYLGKPHSLLSFDQSCCTLRPLARHKKYGNQPNVEEKDRVAFSNSCPYLLISEASLQEVNKRCTKFECTMQRFRPNIVVKGTNAFDEDKWKSLKIGNAEFRCLYRCGRCTLPNVDPQTGIKDKDEPLKTLRSFRLVPEEDDPRYGNAPILGNNLGIQSPGVVKVGDIVFASM